MLVEPALPLLTMAMPAPLLLSRLPLVGMTPITAIPKHVVGSRARREIGGVLADAVEGGIVGVVDLDWMECLRVWSQVVCKGHPFPCDLRADDGNRHIERAPKPSTANIAGWGNDGALDADGQLWTGQESLVRRIRLRS